MTLIDYYLNEFVVDLARFFRGAPWDTEDGHRHFPRPPLQARLDSDLLRDPASCIWCISIHRLINLFKPEAPHERQSRVVSLDHPMTVANVADRLMPKTMLDLSSGRHAISLWLSALLRYEGQLGMQLDERIPEAAQLLKEVHAKVFPGVGTELLVNQVGRLCDMLDDNPRAIVLIPSNRRLRTLRDELHSIALNGLFSEPLSADS